MASIRLSNSLFLLHFCFCLAASVTQGSRTQLLAGSHEEQSVPHLQEGKEGQVARNGRRLMIGSTAPTCTYNECRGCKHKCRAEQVPVEGNDPINSSYHYKCVCHRNSSPVLDWCKWCDRTGPNFRRGPKFPANGDFI